MQIRAWRRNLLPSAHGDGARGFVWELLLKGVWESWSMSRLPRGVGWCWSQYSCSQTEQASEELLMDESIISLKRGLHLP